MSHYLSNNERLKYEAFLIYSDVDEKYAMGLWSTLKKKGYRITHHKDPDGPFKIGKTSYDNMVNAIEQSEKTLALFSKSAVDSGFVSLEMMLALEKSQRIGKCCLYLLSEDLQQEEIAGLKHGLLGTVPNITFDMKREFWDDKLLKDLQEKQQHVNSKFRNWLPVGNLAHGQVFSHFVGYLQHILPGLKDRIRECKVYKANPNSMCLKYFMLIPLSCNTELPLEAKGGGKHTTACIKHEGYIDIEVPHAGKRRPFRPNIYSISKDGRQPIFFVGEFPKALYSVFQLNEREIAAVDRRLEANRFYYTMNNLLNHRLNQKCNDRAILLRYDDDQVNHADVLWSALTEEMRRKDSGGHEKESLAREMSYLKISNMPTTENCKYDVSISCLSEFHLDRDAANQLESYLHSHGKRAVQRDIDSGQFSELGESRWNIFILSKDSFRGKGCKLEWISAVFRSAANNRIQIMTVISNMKMNEVPNALKAVTMISTTQKNYEEIILRQIDGNVVHMQEKMPAGDVSTGLAWGYLLNYIPIQLGECTEDRLDFLGRIRKHLVDKKQDCGCILRFYSILSSTGESVTENPTAPVTPLGRVEAPIIKDQAGTKSRPYYIYMYKYTFTDGKEVCFVAETCTPGLTLHAMASEMEFAGIEQGEILRDQVQNLGDVLEGQVNNWNYIEQMGDFTSRFCLLRCDLDKSETFQTVIERQLVADLQNLPLIKAGDDKV